MRPDGWTNRHVMELEVLASRLHVVRFMQWPRGSTVVVGMTTDAPDMTALSPLIVDEDRNHSGYLHLGRDYLQGETVRLEATWAFAQDTPDRRYQHSIMTNAGNRDLLLEVDFSHVPLPREVKLQQWQGDSKAPNTPYATTATQIGNDRRVRMAVAAPEPGHSYSIDWLV